MTTTEPTLDTLIDACIDKVHTHRNVSFPELARVLEGHGVDAEGTQSVEYSKFNVVLWAGMSATFADVIQSDRFHQATQVDPAHILVYAADGGMLNLPLVKRPPKNGYREPHWAPIVFNPRKTR